jgi:putative transposase
VQGLVKNVTVSLKAGQWFVSIQTERTVALPRHPGTTAAGIDVGIKRFATLWDGQAEQVVQPLNSFKNHEHRLAKAQRQMSRKVKFSSTGNVPKPVSRRSITRLPMCATISCTRHPTASAKTTRCCVSKTCGSAT